MDFNFNGWGDKQEHSHDARVAALVGRQTDAYYLQSELIGEGRHRRWMATAPPS